jgi:predicted nucleic acid-binding protein
MTVAGKWSRCYVTRACTWAARLPFQVDDPPREGTVFALARRHGLTIYDAAYLELAERKKLPLATVDSALIKAAKKVGVVLFKASGS